MGPKLKYSYEWLVEVNRDSIELMLELRQEFETPRTPMVITAALARAETATIPVN